METFRRPRKLRDWWTLSWSCGGRPTQPGRELDTHACAGEMSTYGSTNWGIAQMARQQPARVTQTLGKDFRF